MSSKFFNFILKANQILFFIVAIGVFIAFIISIIPRNYEPPSVKIEKTSNLHKTKQDKKKTMYTKSFYSKIKDVYIIKIQTDKIIHKDKVLSHSSMLSRGYNDEYGLVNLLFVKDESMKYKLLKKDAYIVSFKTIRSSEATKNVYENNYFQLDKNIYSIIQQDTDKDSTLSMKDQQDFYISDYDGKNLKSILKNIKQYKVVDDNIILITKNINKEDLFYMFNIITNKLVLLDTNI